MWSLSHYNSHVRWWWCWEVGWTWCGSNSTHYWFPWDGEFEAHTLILIPCMVLWSCPGASALSTSLSCRLITFRICTNTMTSHLLLSSQEKGAGQYWYRTNPVNYVNNVILMLQFFLVLVTSNSNKIAVSRVWKSVCVGDRSCVLASVSTHDLRHWLGCHCHFRLNSHSECGKFSSVGEIQRGVDWDVRLQLNYDSFEMMIAMLISIGEYRM